MTFRKALPLLALSFLITGCVTDDSVAPDYRIRLAPSPSGKGYVALPPECGNWEQQFGSPQENVASPNFGCATSRNLAVMIERPEDLIEPRKMSPADGVASASAIDRYRAGKTFPLIDPNLENPVAVPTPTTASSPK